MRTNKDRQAKEQVNTKRGRDNRNRFRDRNDVKTQTIIRSMRVKYITQSRREGKWTNKEDKRAEKGETETKKGQTDGQKEIKGSVKER